MDDTTELRESDLHRRGSDKSRDDYLSSALLYGIAAFLMQEERNMGSLRRIKDFPRLSYVPFYI